MDINIAPTLFANVMLIYRDTNICFFLGKQQYYSDDQKPLSLLSPLQQ